MAKKSARRRSRTSENHGTVPQTQYFASLFPGPDHPLNPQFAKAVLGLEQSLQMPVLLLVQDGGNPSLDTISRDVTRHFYSLRDSELQRGQKVALLVDSYGGDVRSAFELAVLLRRYCGGFTAIVPRHAKSAATLLVLGAERLIMAEFAELGPLDMQIVVHEREERISVLDEAQSLERLNAFAMTMFDEFMMLLLRRTGMKITTLIPHVREMVAGVLRPLFESVDVVRFTQMSRSLKIAEEYARRLLVPQYSPEIADEIARRLAEKYPEHGFIIYPDEARRFLSLQVEDPTDEQAPFLSTIIQELPGLTAIGRILVRS